MHLAVQADRINQINRIHVRARPIGSDCVIDPRAFTAWQAPSAAMLAMEASMTLAVWAVNR